MKVILIVLLVLSCVALLVLGVIVFKKKIVGDSISKIEVLVTIITCFATIICTVIPLFSNNTTEEPPESIPTENSSTSSVNSEAATTDISYPIESQQSSVVNSSNENDNTDNETLSNQNTVNIKKTNLLNEVSKYEKSGDYKSAIELIIDCDKELRNDVDVIQKENALKAIYKNNEVSRAKESYNNGNYNEAIAILNSTLTILSSDTDITALIEKYTPVLYRKLTRNALDGNIRKEDIANDSKGNSYIDPLVFYAQFSQYNDGSREFNMPYIEQYTGGKYSKFTATIAPHEELDKYNKGCGAYVKIYADDRLIYTSTPITRKGAVVNVNINISGAQYLKIQVEPTSALQDNMYNRYSILLCDATVYY